MEKIIFLREILHREKNQIGAFFGYDTFLVKLCKMAGMAYSNTYKCWYVENTQDNYFKVKKTFEGKAVINETEFKAAFAARKGKKEEEPRPKNQIPNSKNQIPNSKNQIPRTKFQIPNSKNQIPNSKNQIPRTKFQIPNSKNQIPNLPAVAEAMIRQASCKSEELKQEDQVINKVKPPVTAKEIIIRIDKEKKKIYVKHPVDKEIFSAIRGIEKSYWQKDKKEWVLPGTNECLSLIKQTATNAGYTYKTEAITEIEKKETIAIIQYYIDSLRLKNYSPNTIDAYLPYFKQFVIYFGENKIDALGVKQLHEYVKNIIDKQKLTEIPVKHLISAIKFYYEKIKGRDKIYFNLAKKYEITSVEIKLSIAELLPFIEIMKQEVEKLLILFKFHYGYSAETICRITINSVNEFLKTKAGNGSDENSLIIEILKAYLENNKPDEFLIENKSGKQVLPGELEKGIYRIVSKYKIAAVYKYELNEAMVQAKFEDTTRRVYAGYFSGFLKHFNYRHPLEITDKEIREYLVEIRQVEELSPSYLNQMINVITFYYTKIKDRRIMPGTLIRPKKEKGLPEVLSRDEFVQMINKTENKKHRLAIILLYSLGLRRQELLDLKINDFDFTRNVVTIRKGKGKKDRQLAIPENLRIMVIEFIRDFSPGKYIIEGGLGNEKYSTTSIVNIVHEAANKASVKKKVHPHILRHSIATHMIEQGIDIAFVKEFLGHESIKTTLRYTHLNSDSMQKVRNPFDNLNFGEPDKIEQVKK